MLRHFLAVAFLISTGLQAAPPNLLLFLADDMTFTDLGCYGNPDVKTPALDRIASEGMRFTRFYAPSPTCAPLRQSLYTGIYPVRNGAHPNHSRVYDGVKSIPDYLRPLGYRVAIVGKRHEAPAEAFPFEMLGGTHHDGGKTPDGSDLPLEKAREFIERDSEQPWCLIVASNQPHSPWNRGDQSPYAPEDLTVPPYLVDTKETREALSKYYAEVTYMDRQVDQVMQILRETGEGESTAFLWLSEQGSGLPFCKWTCYDTGIHAAALLRWPGEIKPASKSDALISYVDVLPTFLELAGGTVKGQDFDGKSFAPLLRGETDKHHEMVFATHTTRGIYNGSEAYAIRAATDGNFLYIRNLHADSRFENMVTAKDGVYRSWKSVDTDFARNRVSAYQVRPAEELFDLKNDPWCLNNLAASKGRENSLARFSSRLDDWMDQQGDEGDATERDAQSRQPQLKPWTGKNGYNTTQSSIEN